MLQLSAVMECSDAAHGLDGHIISDGGAVVLGDLSKAFGGGGDFVMLGSMLSGHDECDGELIEEDGKMYKKVLWNVIRYCNEEVSWWCSKV